MKIGKVSSFSQNPLKGNIAQKQGLKENLQVKNLEISKSANTSITNYGKANIHAPYAVLSFCGKNTRKDQMAFIGAELPPYCKVGGVGTVMKDYCDFSPEARMFIPYYNGALTYDPQTGDPVGVASVHKIQIGDKTVPIYTGADLSKKSIEEVVAAKDYFELEEIATSKMQMGLIDQPIGLYQVKGQNHYMVYTPQTAAMPKPYGNIAYATEAVSTTKGWDSNAYADFDKALVKLLPSLEEKGFSPETVICSDVQCAYIPEYMAKEALDGSEFYQGMKPSYVGHNVGRGYIGNVDGRQMFVNSGATKEQIRAVENDPDFLDAMLSGKTTDYFKKIMPEVYDETTDSFSPTLIPLKHAKDGYVSSFDVVSETYAKAIADNPRISPALYVNGWSKLMQENRVGGIMNPLNDPSLTPYEYKGLPKGFTNPLVVTNDGKVIIANAVEEVDGKKIYKTLVKKADNSEVMEEIADVQKVFEPFKLFTKGASYEETKKIKGLNQANLFERLSGKYPQAEVINGLFNGRPAYVMGGIGEEYAQMAKSGDPVNLIVSWGRADYQKGFDITLNAFEKFAKTPQGKNAVLIAGAGITGVDNGEIPLIKKSIDRILSDPELKGRFVFVDGFAPAKALSSAGDIALFTSRFEPCGLTDLEALKYMCTPVVTNVDGFVQKNFDPRLAAEAHKATSFKTKHEYFMSDALIDKIKSAYSSTGTEEAKQAVKTEFADVDESLFKSFAKKFESLVDKELVKLGKQKFSESDTPIDFKALAMKSVLKSDAYKAAEKELLDGVMVDECVAALKAQAELPEETVKTIFDNQVKLDTSWKGNFRLNSGDISTHDLYQIRQINPTPVAPKETIINMTDIIESAVKTNDDIIQNVETSVKNDNVVKGLKNILDNIPKRTKTGVLFGAAAVAFMGMVAICRGLNKRKLNQSIAVQPISTSLPSAPAVQAAPTQAATPSVSTLKTSSMNDFLTNLKK